jgi:predicted methyltransferase
MKVSVETKVTIEVMERSMMPWLEASKVMAKIMKKKNDDIMKTKEIMKAFKDAGLVDMEEAEKRSKGCCVIL